VEQRRAGVGERVPKLAGPLAIAMAGMEPNVREEIKERALKADASASRNDVDQVVFPGSVLIGSGHTPRH
jgi:hypothetical protein